jgi:hypothetical protein
MAEEEQRLIEEARKSQEETQDLREESGLGRDDEPEEPPEKDKTESLEGEPWAKTSSGDADEVTDDDS